MAATDTTAKATRAAEANADRIVRLNEQMVEASRKAGLTALENVETTWNTVADYTDKVADSTQVDWIASTFRAQANLTREFTKVYTTSARDLIRA
jgi:hypothetical protein